MCEGDDYWTDKEKLKKQVSFLSAHPDYVVAYHDVMIISEKDETISQSWLGARKVDYSNSELLWTGRIHSSTLCFRKVIDTFPPEMFQAFGGDYFLTSLLGNYGGAKYIDAI